MNPETFKPRDRVARLVAMPRETYEAQRARANFSTLKHFAKSPAHYRHAVDSPGREDTPAMKLGRVAHLAILEPEKCADGCVIWDGGTRRGKAWDAFVEANVGREILTADEAAACLGMARAVRADREAMRYLDDGAAETTALWQDAESGRLCRGRMDWLASCGASVDLKTTVDGSPGAFGRAAWTGHYHSQGAFYTDAIHAATGERFRHVLIVVEKKPPYVVQVYVVPQHAIDAGRASYRGWLRRLDECERAGRWPGYADGLSDLVIPRFADLAGESADDDTDDTANE